MENKNEQQGNLESAQGVPGTALLTNSVKTREGSFNETKTWKKRAEKNDRPAGSVTRIKEYLYKPDQFAKHFDVNDSQKIATAFLNNSGAGDTGIESFLSLRHKYILKKISAFVNKHSGATVQIVILGTGLSPYTARMNLSIKEKYKNVTSYEVDFEDTLKFKENIYTKNNIHPNAKYVGMDYVKGNTIGGLIQNLIAQSIDLTKPTYFIWEGNVMYLQPKEVEQILKHIHDNFSDPTVSFDYLSPRFIDKTTGIAAIDKFTQTLADSKACFFTGFNELSLDTLANSTSMNLKENFSGNELAQRYQVDGGIEEDVLEHFGICTMQK